jgi:hypothetical protein
MGLVNTTMHIGFFWWEGTGRSAVDLTFLSRCGVFIHLEHLLDLVSKTAHHEFQGC